MARTLATEVQARLKTVLTNAAGTTVTTNGGSRELVTLASGTGAGQCDQVYYSAARTLGTTTAELLDLAGTLVNEQGETITFTKIKSVLLINNGTNDGDIIRLGGASNTAAIFAAGTNTMDIRGGTSGGGLLLWCSELTGYEITGGSADILQVENPGTNALTYDIHLAGVKA
jgi:hypothetical protein